MKKENSSSSSRSSYCLDLDGFSTPFQWHYIKGQTDYRSACGGAMNVLLTVIVGILFANFLTVMVLRADSNINESVESNAIVVGPENSVALGDEDGWG